LTPGCWPGNVHENGLGRKPFSADETRVDETSGDLVARTVITKGLVFDGTGMRPVPGEVTLADDRVVSVTPGHHDNHGRDDHGSDRVIDATGCTVMPGLIESHGHLTFPSAVGHIAENAGIAPPASHNHTG
jgi:imidazolonepropionase-like amidohydrolase